MKDMIAHVTEYSNAASSSSSTGPIMVSVELEKRRPDLSQLISLPDVLFVSKEYAGYHGYSSPEEACQEFKKKAKPK